LLISETNFFFSTLLSLPLLALRQISVSPTKQKEIHKWRATIRNSHQGILGGSKIFAASRISLPIGISLEPTICQLPMSWLPASTRKVHLIEFSWTRDDCVRFLERTRSLV
jgi:hypothetical protein